VLVIGTHDWRLFALSALAVVLVGAVGRRLARRAAAARERRASAERLRGVSSALSVGVLVEGADGQIDYANEAAERLLGAAHGQLAGRVSGNPLLRELRREDGVADTAETHPVAVARRTRAPVRGALRTVRVEAPEGELFRGQRWLLIDAIPLPADGRLVVTLTDITERRRAVSQARESEARGAAIVATALDPIVVIDAQGRVTEFNAAAERVFGHRREDVLGRDMAELLVPPDLRDAHRRGRERFLATGAPHVIGRRIETRGLRADGTEIPIELAITALPDADTQSFAGYMRDLTERRRYERSLRFLADASAALAESLEYETTLARVPRLAVPDFADWCAVDLLAEEAGERRLRRLAISHVEPAREALVQQLQEKYPPDLDASGGVAQVLRTGKPLLVAEVTDEMLAAAARDPEHLRLARALGLRSYIAAPLVARDRVTGVVTFAQAESERRFNEGDLALATDLARRMAAAIENARLYQEVAEARDQLEHQAAQLEAQAVQMEESQQELEVINQEIQQTNDELLRKTDEAERARVAADEANRAKSEFLAMMSHELRTPLNAIGGYAQLLELGVRGPVTEAQRLDLQRIQRSQAHLAHLVNDVLNFAKLDAGQVEFRVEELPVNALLAGMDAMVRPQLDAKSLRYEFRPGDAAVTVRADRERLQQILLNLLTNAVKFTEPGGRIVLDWTADKGCVRVCVSDTGVGIAAERLEWIFEPFVQVNRQLTAGTEGIGLGLTISRDIARAMGGELSVRSAPGEGSTFTVTMPRGAPAAPDGAGVVAEPSASAAD
jgi:PAS domain S-box-containing protein